MGALRLLLDTHCWLWLKLDPTRLPSPLRRRLIGNPAQLVLSSASVLEIVVKHASGKLRLEGTPADLVAELLDDGVSPLAITTAHALQLGRLPELHRDPFDRLLVAQAMTERLTIVSADPHVLSYDVAQIDART
jgi:PIN domain nuclease of toxin-antitoxin system